MANWKTGWCIGERIENISNKDKSSAIWYPSSVDEAKNHLGDVFRFLGNEDSDIVYLSFLLKKRQNDVCRILGKTQPAISYDLGRIKKQIDFVVYLLSVVDEFVYFIENEEHELTVEQVNILVLIFFSTSFSKTAKILGYHQITCRNKFSKVMIVLEEKGYTEIKEIFTFIMKNLNRVKNNIYKGI